MDPQPVRGENGEGMGQAKEQRGNGNKFPCSRLRAPKSWTHSNGPIIVKSISGEDAWHLGIPS
jgi:hypothetical protein